MARLSDRWTDAEVDLLKKLWPQLGAKSVDRFPGRTPSALQVKARALGIKCLAKHLPHNKGKGKVKAPVRSREDYDRQQGVRYQVHRQRNAKKAREALSAGKTPEDLAPALRHIARAEVEAQAEAKRRECPIEQAKLVLQAERIKPVVAMAFTDRGGPSNLYQVGHMLNVSKEDLLALAAKIRARKQAA